MVLLGADTLHSSGRLWGIFIVTDVVAIVFWTIKLWSLQGVIGVVFIKANAYFCRLRKTTRLGQYPILEVVAMGFITALVSFPNPFTRDDNSSLIAKLFRDCGPADVSDLWYERERYGLLRASLCVCAFLNVSLLDSSDYNRTYLSVTATLDKSEPGEGVKRAMWQLFLAFIVKLVLSIMSVGMKVNSEVVESLLHE